MVLRPVLTIQNESSFKLNGSVVEFNFFYFVVARIIDIPWTPTLS